MSGRYLALAIALCLGALPAPPTGTKYRFHEDSLVGTVWVLGDNARREIETGEGGLADGRVEIWKDGGRQIFVLDPKEHTYYERNAFRRNPSVREVSELPFSVTPPFRVSGVEDVKVDVNASGRTETVPGGYECEPTTLRFSYTLRLVLQMDNSTIPARVEGATAFCIMNSDAITRNLWLPFGHGLELKSDHEVTPDRFEVPKDYRFQEPVITGPVRR